MRKEVGDATTDVFLSGDEAKEICLPKPGRPGCAWLIIGAEFQCTVWNKPHLLVDRLERGEMKASRDGCDGKGRGPPILYENDS